MICFTLLADFDRTAWVNAWAIWQNIAYGSFLAWLSLYSVLKGAEQQRVKWVMYYSGVLLLWELTAMITGWSIDNEFAVAVAFGLLAVVCLILAFRR